MSLKTESEAAARLRRADRHLTNALNEVLDALEDGKDLTTAEQQGLATSARQISRAAVKVGRVLDRR